MNDGSHRAARGGFSHDAIRGPAAMPAGAARSSSFAVARVRTRIAAFGASVVVALALVVPLGLVAPPPAVAQKLYKYRDANGTVVFTDRQPGTDQPFETSQMQRTFEKPEVRLSQRAAPNGVTVLAANTYFVPVQVLYRVTRATNAAADTPREGLKLLPARVETALVDVKAADPSMPVTLDYEFQYLPGDPKAMHVPDRPYRLPYATSLSIPVSQAYPDTFTHGDPSSNYAVDFVMPIGTNVLAARGGTVIEVASDFHESGTNAEIDGPRANVVRVLHDDGTMALYGHLNWNSIRVVPGQHVQRGEYLADSGNTGFSTGPHLHFVVQRNRGGAIVSLPVEFAGPSNEPITVHSGARYTAR